MAFGCAGLVMLMTLPPPAFMGNITPFVAALFPEIRSRQWRLFVRLCSSLIQV